MKTSKSEDDIHQLDHDDPLLDDPIPPNYTSYGTIPSKHRFVAPNSVHRPPSSNNLTVGGGLSNIYQSYRLKPQPRHLVVQHREDSDSDDSLDDDALMYAKERLLEKAAHFQLPYEADRGYRATQFQFCSTARPHMRAMHASWICFFASGACQFAMAPLLPQLQKSLHLSKQDVWWTHVGMMVGGVPMRFLLGPLCDSYGPRLIMVWIVALCAIPCAFSGLVVVNMASLMVVRCIMGAMDAFVPCQCWITSQFVREVGGTIMAVAGGLGASGAGFTQLAVGSLFTLCLQWTGDDSDLAWRIALIFPAIFALVIAWWSFVASDDCPLGNFVDVKRAGLMMQRSAVDSFRSGAINFNSWLLFLQFAGCCGVDFTMCNGCALYFHHRFGQNIQASGAIAFGYGFAAIYARGLGGYVSDLLGDSFQLQGRLWIPLGFMLIQGALNIWFARISDLDQSISIMIIFSIFVQVCSELDGDQFCGLRTKTHANLVVPFCPVQMSMGTCYGVVPYVDSPNTGSVAGIVGAGGNVGAAILGLFFIKYEYPNAMEYMGWFTIATGLLTPLIVIKGYSGILFGHDDKDDASRTQYSPLLVPKMGHSPHLVKLRQKRRDAGGL